MELEGKVWKDGNFWLIEVPILDVMTQGKSKKEALAMIEDAVQGLMECYFEGKLKKEFSVKAISYKDNIVGLTSNDNNFLMAFSLIRQREKSKSTVRDVSFRLGSKSPNAFGQYERGKVSMTVEKYEQLLMAANPSERRQIRVY